MNDTTPSINLNEEPSVTLFKPSNWLAKINFIKHLMTLNNVLITVCADLDSGKTTFIHLLQNELDATIIRSHVLNANVGFSAVDVLSNLIDIFELSSDCIKTLANFFEYINQQKITTLLIIDDAQYLPQAFLEECLVEIKNYGSGNFFHICLVSDFTLVSALNRLNTFVFENLIHTIILGSLTEDETKTYVMKTLSVCNCLDNQVTAQRLHAFYHLTEGNIGVINREMTHFFDKKITRQHTIVKKSFKPVALIASVVIASLSATYTWQHRVELFPKYQVLAQKDAIAEIISSLKASEQIVEHPLVSNLPKLTSNAIKESLSVQKLVSETASSPVISQVVSLAAESLSSLTDDNDLVLSKDIQRIDAAQLDKLVAINDVTDDNNVDKVAPKVVSNLQEPIALNQDILVAAASTATIKQQTLQSEINLIEDLKHQPSMPMTSSKKTTVMLKSSSSRATTMNKKPAKSKLKPIPSVVNSGQFTIQLMASRSQDFITDFMNTHHVGKAAKIHRVKNNGVNWYVLTMGNYEKRNDANHAIQQLPIPLANLKPWIRAITTLS